MNTQVKLQNRYDQLKTMLKARKDPKTGEYRPGTEKEVELIREEMTELFPMLGKANA